MKKNKTFLPDFIVVGTAKSGTTALFDYLSNIDEIFLPDIKEPRFLSKVYINNLTLAPNGVKFEKDYLSLYKNYSYKLKGDMSVDSFYFYKQTTNSIKSLYTKHNQEFPKIIICLRNPYERVYSLFNQLNFFYQSSVLDASKYPYYKKCINESINYSKKNKSIFWEFDLFENGIVAPGVEHFMLNFSEVHIIFFEDLISNNFKEALSRFLNISQNGNKLNQINPTIRTESIYFSLYRLCYKLNYLFNRNKYLKKFKTFFPFLKHANNFFANKLSEKKELPHYTSNFFDNDIRALSNVINKDLKHWLLN